MMRVLASLHCLTVQNTQLSGRTCIILLFPSVTDIQAKDSSRTCTLWLRQMTNPG